mmetsp:Transcript_11886/g.18018  ORF Transcript_11886/g.18018 Transcript_11886/m.18018 type:complete len:102 (-) Transcript_11886:1075-1380(-)
MKEKRFSAYAAFDQKPIMNQKDDDPDMGLCVGLATMFIMHYEVGVYIILNAADGNHRKNIEKLPKFVQDMIRLIQNHHDSQMLGTNFFKALECKFNEDRRS